MKVCVTGSRSINEAEKVFPAIDRFLRENTHGNITFLCGDGKGIDQLIQEYAKKNGIDVVKFLPYHLIDNRSRFNSKFFFIRTKQMLDNADKVLAIWDTKSKGTEYAIKYSQKHSKPIMILKSP